MCSEGETAEELEATRSEVDSLRVEHDRLAGLHKEKLQRMHEVFHPVWCALAAPLLRRVSHCLAAIASERSECHRKAQCPRKHLCAALRCTARSKLAGGACRGQMMKTGYQNSMYASLMERFACLYTSHVSNLALYSPYMKFRGRVDVMAHEHGHGASPAAEAEAAEARAELTIISRAPEAAAS